MIAKTLDTLLTALWLFYIAAGFVYDLRGWLPEQLGELGRHIFFEIKPFALTLIVAGLLADIWAYGDPNGYAPVSRIVNISIQLAYWAITRNKKDDDDRWKKRRRKATEAIQRVGARLVVVPQGAST